MGFNSGFKGLITCLVFSLYHKSYRNCRHDHYIEQMCRITEKLLRQMSIGRFIPTGLCCNFHRLVPNICEHAKQTKRRSKQTEQKTLFFSVYLEWRNSGCWIKKCMSTLRMGQIGCLETLVRNYHCSLRNNPEERSSTNNFRFRKLFCC